MSSWVRSTSASSVRKGPGVGEPAAIRFDGVGKRFGLHRVLDRLSLSIDSGESLALVGMNGAGKSTCLKALLDLCDVDSGAIEIFGIPHTEPRARTALAFLPEPFLPPWYLGGRDFLRYMARLHGAPWRGEHAREVCGQLELDPETLTRPARHLSRGMSQKLGLAALFLSGRNLLVLDEPMSGLDPWARRLVRHRLERHRAAGGTLFFSTHDLAGIEALCDRIAVLDAGTVTFAGTPQECMRRFGGGTIEDACLRCIGAAAPSPRSAPAPRPSSAPR